MFETNWPTKIKEKLFIKYLGKFSQLDIATGKKCNAGWSGFYFNNSFDGYKSNTYELLLNLNLR